MKLLAGLLVAIVLRAQPVPVSPADADERRIITERFATAKPADLAWGAHHPGFPPVVFYLLGSGETLLVGGPHPVYYEVVLSPSRCYSSVSREEYSLDYLRVITGVSEAQAPRPQNASITWTTATQYEDEARRFRNSVHFFLSILREALVKRGLLTPEEAALLPIVGITVIDRREDQSVPLPVADRGF